MTWYNYLAHFIAGALLANGLPHFVQGVCGNRFPTPFASPPGVGESSALINAVWGWFNFLIGLALLRYFFVPLPPPPGISAATILGVLVAGIFLASHFARVRNGASRL
jgi:hypothetical protein